MQVTIFGSTGRTGNYLVEEALKAGYQVTAFMRNPERFRLEHPRLTIRQGELMDRESVSGAIQGAGAVLDVLGPSSNKVRYSITQGTESILSGMKLQGVRRLIITAGAGIHDPNDLPTPMSRLMDALVKTLSRNVYEDMLGMVELVRKSDLDWTIVRVPMLTDQPKMGKVKVAWVGKGMNPRLTRGDLAAFLVSQIEDMTYIRQSPAVSND
jgi:putative NADH-flavin reductase